jgi:hypothetical protein
MRNTGFVVMLIWLVLQSCNLPSDQNNLPSNDNSNTVLSGTAVYIQSDKPWRGAVGTRVGAYQNDAEVSFAVITSEEGYFQLKDLQTGVYDVVFMTPEKFSPSKIADVAVRRGNNTLESTVRLGIFSVPLVDSDVITVVFKPYVSDEDIQKLIEESGCKLSSRLSSLFTPTVLYILRIPDGQTPRATIEWLLKKSSVGGAAIGAIAPVD